MYSSKKIILDAITVISLIIVCCVALHVVVDDAYLTKRERSKLTPSCH